MEKLEIWNIKVFYVRDENSNISAITIGISSPQSMVNKGHFVAIKSQLSNLPLIPLAPEATLITTSELFCPCKQYKEKNHPWKLVLLIDS